MLGVGWTEMLVLGVVALIVIGPRDLPMLMQRLGKVVGTVRRMGSEFQREINKTTGLDQVRDLRKSITEPLRQTTAEIAREFNAMGKDGSVQPTGALKPTDPAVESVYDTIAKQAGIETKSPAASAAIAAAVTSSVAAESAKAAEQVKAAAKPKRVAKATPAPTTPVTASDLPPVPAKPARKAAAKDAEPSAAPVEAIAPARKTEPKAPLKPAASPVKRSTPPKPAAKPAAKPAVANKTAAEKPVVEPAKPVPKPRAKKG